jgi:ribosomal protein L24
MDVSEGTSVLVTGGKYDGQVATVLSVAAKTCRLTIAGQEEPTGNIDKTQLEVVGGSGGRGGGDISEGASVLVTGGKYDGQVATVLSVAAKTCRLTIAGQEEPTGNIDKTRLAVVVEATGGGSGDGGISGISGARSGSIGSIGTPSTPPRQNICVGTPESGESKMDAISQPLAQAEAPRKARGGGRGIGGRVGGGSGPADSGFERAFPGMYDSLDALFSMGAGEYDSSDDSDDSDYDPAAGGASGVDDDDDTKSCYSEDEDGGMCSVVSV